MTENYEKPAERDNTVMRDICMTFRHVYVRIRQEI